MKDKAPSTGKGNGQPRATDREDHNETQSENGSEQGPMTFRQPKPESDSDEVSVDDREVQKKPPKGSKEYKETADDSSDEGEEGEDENDEDDEEEEEEDDDDDDEEEDEDEEDDEPRLKYARLTQHLGGVYRNGDATSSFLVAGDKMVSE